MAVSEKYQAAKKNLHRTAEWMAAGGKSTPRKYGQPRITHSYREVDMIAGLAQENRLSEDEFPYAQDWLVHSIILDKSSRTICIHLLNTNNDEDNHWNHYAGHESKLDWRYRIDSETRYFERTENR